MTNNAEWRDQGQLVIEIKIIHENYMFSKKYKQ